MTVATLLVGTAWALGWLTLTVGHLNILSSAFAVMLIGMGDYGVLWVTRFGQERKAGYDVRTAMRTTAPQRRPGILTAAMTTALAFFATMLADFKAVAELGWIAGCGVLSVRHVVLHRHAGPARDPRLPLRRQTLNGRRRICRCGSRGRARRLAAAADAPPGLVIGVSAGVTVVLGLLRAPESITTTTCSTCRRQTRIGQVGAQDPHRTHRRHNWYALS